MCVVERHLGCCGDSQVQEQVTEFACRVMNEGAGCPRARYHRPPHHHNSLVNLSVKPSNDSPAFLAPRYLRVVEFIRVTQLKAVQEKTITRQFNVYRKTVVISYAISNVEYLLLLSMKRTCVDIRNCLLG